MVSKPGGNDVGQRMGHYIEPGGPFERVCSSYLAKSPAILYHDHASEEDTAKTRKKKAVSKTKYTCPVCAVNAWAKLHISLVCGECEEELEADLTHQAKG